MRRKNGLRRIWPMVQGGRAKFTTWAGTERTTPSERLTGPKKRLELNHSANPSPDRGSGDSPNPKVAKPIPEANILAILATLETLREIVAFTAVMNPNIPKVAKITEPGINLAMLANLPRTDARGNAHFERKPQHIDAILTPPYFLKGLKNEHCRVVSNQLFIVG